MTMLFSEVLQLCQKKKHGGVCCEAQMNIDYGLIIYQKQSTWELMEWHMAWVCSQHHVFETAPNLPCMCLCPVD